MVCWSPQASEGCICRRCRFPFRNSIRKGKFWRRNDGSVLHFFIKKFFSGSWCFNYVCGKKWSKLVFQKFLYCFPLVSKSKRHAVSLFVTYNAIIRRTNLVMRTPVLLFSSPIIRLLDFEHGHFQATRAPIQSSADGCSFCQLPILSEDFLRLSDGRSFHNECLRCDLCHQPLENRQRCYQQQGQLICDVNCVRWETRRGQLKQRRCVFSQAFFDAKLVEKWGLNCHHKLQTLSTQCCFWLTSLASAVQTL